VEKGGGQATRRTNFDVLQAFGAFGIDGMVVSWVWSQGGRRMKSICFRHIFVSEMLKNLAGELNVLWGQDLRFCPKWAAMGITWGCSGGFLDGYNMV